MNNLSVWLEKPLNFGVSQNDLTIRQDQGLRFEHILVWQKIKMEIKEKMIIL